jgi:Ca2+-binding EF-hand superfamily protein
MLVATEDEDAAMTTTIRTSAFFVAMTGTGIAFIGSALAGEPAKAPQVAEATSQFKKLDMDRDGRVSNKEARTEQTLDESFGALDRNGDGYLTATEFAGWTGAKGDPTGPVDPSTGPSGSSSAQHMPKTK